MPGLARVMSTIVLALAAACGGRGARRAGAAAAPAPSGPVDPIAAKVLEYEAAVCACESQACAEKLQQGVNDWAAEHADELRRAFGDKIRAARLEPHVDRIAACTGALAGREDDDEDDDGGGGSGASGRGSADQTIALMGQMADDLCACKDMACAESVMKAMSSLKEPAGKPSKAQMEKAMRLAEKMADCQRALMAANAPAPPDPTAMDIVRPPLESDLDVFLQGVKGRGTLTATIDTTMGAFHCELFEDDAPVAVANFVGLATGQKPWTDPRNGQVQQGKRFYDGLGFHRVVPEFMIQGGDPLGNGTGGPGYQFDEELVATLRHDGPGVLSMANAGPGTNGSQFFITEKAAPWLDGKHTVFGRCQEGKLVKKISALAGPGDRPSKPVTIKRVTFARR
jgi:cyclophilin family peptidyl-prolyl cis-trans isomerase